MSFNGFRGHIGGSVQTSYADQPGAGVPGMLAFASDINLTDSVYIGEATGIAAGLGVVFVDVDNTAAPANLQRPGVAAYLPDSTTVAYDFKGVVVFDEQMQSDENGVPGYASGRVGRVLVSARVGGRIYVNTPVVVNHTLDEVYMQIVADATFAVGEFSNALDVGNSILLPNCRWVTSSEIGGIAVIEIK